MTAIFKRAAQGAGGSRPCETCTKPAWGTTQPPAACSQSQPNLPRRAQQHSTHTAMPPLSLPQNVPLSTAQAAHTPPWDGRDAGVCHSRLPKGATQPSNPIPTHVQSRCECSKRMRGQLSASHTVLPEARHLDCMCQKCMRTLM